LCCLHCIVLDEFIIHGSWGASAGWENNTLLSELFNLQSGGDLFFTITEKAMRQSGKMLDLLAIITIFMQMGFRGRYRSRQSEKIGLILKQVSSAVSDDVVAPKILIQENPVDKALLLVSSRHYLAITFIFTLLLVATVSVFDYWFEETYPTRSREISALNEITLGYRTDAKLENKVNQDKIISKIKDIVEREETVQAQPILSTYRVQLSSFTVTDNADAFVKSLAGTNYPLLIKQIGKYFVVYSNANSLSEAEHQQQYYKDSYQISAIVFALDNKSDPAS